jgi:CRP-like cAMP-binding protein
MSAFPIAPSPNALVGVLSAAARAQLEPAWLTPFEVALEPGVCPTHVYFPIGCVATLMLTLQDGSTGQAAMVGSEGMLGLDLFLGAPSRLTEAIALVHIGGAAWRLAADDFQAEVARNYALEQRLARYTLALASQLARTAACFRQHSVEQQLCRWLLQTHDRAGSPHLAITAESIANLLGLRREAVFAAAAQLEQVGFLRQDVERIDILARDGLESRCCSCYQTMRRCEHRALTGAVDPAAWNGGATPHGATGLYR